MKYKYHKDKPFRINGLVETLNGIHNSIVIVESERFAPRDPVTIKTTMEIVKRFIPYLYKDVNVEFIKGDVIFNET